MKEIKTQLRDDCAHIGDSRASVGARSRVARKYIGSYTVAQPLF